MRYQPRLSWVWKAAAFDDFPLKCFGSKGSGFIRIHGLDAASVVF